MKNKPLFPFVLSEDKAPCSADWPVVFARGERIKWGG
jgi:hypothetical protein